MVEKGHLGSLPLTKSVPATPILVAGPMNGVWPRSPSLLICVCHIAQGCSPGCWWPALAGGDYACLTQSVP